MKTHKKLNYFVKAVSLYSVILSGHALAQTDLNIVYKESGQENTTKWLTQVKEKFQKSHPDVEIKLKPLFSGDSDYFAKSSLMLQSKDDIDVLVIDSFLTTSLTEPGYISALPVDKWSDWSEHFYKDTHQGVKVKNQYYGVPISTDTRGLFYSKAAFEKANIAVPWQPKSWADITEAVKKLKKANIQYPLWINASRAQGEGTSMQTFEMLLSGTPDWIFENNKWVVSSQGMLDTLSYIKDIYVDQNVLGKLDMATMLNGTSWIALNKKFPNDEIGIVLDGNWKATDWKKATPDYHQRFEVTPMPKQHGDGYTSMSGGWAISIASGSKHKDLAFEFIKEAVSKDSSLFLSNLSGDMTPRNDVAQDKRYIEMNTMRAQMNKYLDFTHYRPGNSDYPKVSTEITSAVEDVILGKKTPEQAMKTYRENVTRIVGAENVVDKK